MECGEEGGTDLKLDGRYLAAPRIGGPEPAVCRCREKPDGRQAPMFKIMSTLPSYLVRPSTPVHTVFMGGLRMCVGPRAGRAASIIKLGVGMFCSS